MTKVTKAVIPAAGLGTRFLPATKTVPKEMLTIVDAPIIFYVVEEAVKAGIEDIVLIQGRGKTAIEDFFDTSYELEQKLEKDNKIHLLDRLISIRKMANIISVRQKEPLGLGHAVLCAESVIGQNPFAILLGDEIMLPQNGAPTTTETLAKLYEKSGASTVSVMEVPTSEVSKYGIADVTTVSPGYFKVKGFIEKPSADKAPSRWALPGRYVFHPEIFSDLKNAKPGLLGEIQLTDSMNELAKKRDVFASVLQAKRYDAGDKLGYLRANLELGMLHPEIGEDVKAMLLETATHLKEFSRKDL
jgi:UTP--glucose-1-phosphate uridylyltransferase